ncbi:MAG: hypothetical protein KatS3mg108_2915 [Isosphaeraceae bacterium]|jgi:hypothetical protein|nr:MAG: hypothetical protein KatS3mg108_2915 [Isosphaeraceae bacterium]
MQRLHATMALSISLALAGSAPSLAQSQRRLAPRLVPTPPSSNPTAPTASDTANPPASDTRVTRTVEVPPEPIPIEDLGKPEIALPDGPIEPYLLRKEHGPFMIMAHTFRGPEATRYALALAMELQSAHGLPAYIFHLKIQPGGSNIRNVQPTAARDVENAQIDGPEKYRVFDEAAVLVGHCKSIDEAEKLLKRVKKIKPQCLDALPSIWGHRKGQGLYRAHITANPLQPAQVLYPGRNPNGHHLHGNALPTQPGQAFDPYVAAAAFERMPKPDPLIKRINGGPRSLFNCPGPYTLQVAEFAGRSSADANDPKFGSESFLKKSPLMTAADDAERLAEALQKCKSLDPAFKPYVYHDRTRSIVTIGHFTGPDDPNLKRLRDAMPSIIGELLQRRFTQLPLAPAADLMPVPR